VISRLVKQPLDDAMIALVLLTRSQLRVDSILLILLQDLSAPLASGITAASVLLFCHENTIYLLPPPRGKTSSICSIAKLMHSWGFTLREGVFAETKEGICRNKIQKASFKEFKKSAS